MLKHCPLVLPLALCKAQLCVLKFDLCLWLSGAPKDDPNDIFFLNWSSGGVWFECTTNLHNLSVTDSEEVHSLACLKRMIALAAWVQDSTPAKAGRLGPTCPV